MSAIMDRASRGGARAVLKRRRDGDGLWLLASCAVALALIGLWALVSGQQWISKVFLPTPQQAWSALLEGMAGGELRERTAATLERMVYGWLIASLGGVLVGALIGLSRQARIWLLPSLELLRPLPATALLPVGIALLGLTPGMLLAVVAFGAAWPVLLATAHGFSTIEPRLQEVARILGLGRLAFIWKFVLPHAMPDILAGMRLSLTASLIVAVVGEMVTAQDGLGTTIMDASRSFRSADLYAGVILLGAMGYLGNLLLQTLERRLLRWRQ